MSEKSTKTSFYPVKNSGFKVKDIDESNRQVVFYAAAFDNKDTDGDVIPKGAFSKTIKERGPKGANRIKHLYQHKISSPVGMPVEMTEDNTGLRVVSKISNSTLGKDAIEDYKLDLYEHSIGFEVVDDDFDNERDANILKEIKLMEVSSVTWGANPNTPLLDMKHKCNSCGEDLLKDINERMVKLTKAVTKGKHTDDALLRYEIELKQLQQAYNDIIQSLKREQEPGDPTPKRNEPVDLVSVFENSLTQN